MLYENVKKEIDDSKSLKKKGGDSSMSLLLIRPFEVMYHGERYPVVMVRVDASGNRLYALPNKEKTDPPEPLKWVAERWIEEVIPLDQP